MKENAVYQTVNELNIPDGADYGILKRWDRENQNSRWKRERGRSNNKENSLLGQ